jgi:WhiB family transcriptional regulator, redox-sensing transcriptional regulator
MVLDPQHEPVHQAPAKEEAVTIAASPDQGARQHPERPSRPVNYDRASWREAAACRFLDTEIFFPISKTGLGLVEIQEAKEVCSRCPVRPACLTFALDTRQGYGIWGGYDEEERRMLLRQRHGW